MDLGLDSGETMTKILSYLWRHYSMFWDLLFGPNQFFHFFVKISAKYLIFENWPQDCLDILYDKTMLHDGNANCIEPTLTFAPSNFRKLQRFFSSAANCQAGTTSIQGEWRKMLSYYNTIRRRVDSLVAQSVQHSSALHI